jgi:hypothetical protein
MTSKLSTKSGGNDLVNVLSRKREKMDALLCVISIFQAFWVEEAKIECQQDQATW